MAQWSDSVAIQCGPRRLPGAVSSNEQDKARSVDSMPFTSLRLYPLLLVAVLLAVSGVDGAHASREGSLQATIDRVEREHDGKVLAVQVVERNKRRIYIIKVLTGDGRVKVVQVRATE